MVRGKSLKSSMRIQGTFLSFKYSFVLFQTIAHSSKDYGLYILMKIHSRLQKLMVPWTTSQCFKEREEIIDKNLPYHIEVMPPECYWDWAKGLINVICFLESSDDFRREIFHLWFLDCSKEGFMNKYMLYQGTSFHPSNQTSNIPRQDNHWNKILICERGKELIWDFWCQFVYCVVRIVSVILLNSDFPPLKETPRTLPMSITSSNLINKVWTITKWWIVMPFSSQLWLRWGWPFFLVIIFIFFSLFNK